MATKTGTITARLSKYGAVTENYDYDEYCVSGTAERFANGTGTLLNAMSSYQDNAIFYGFNFESLRGLPNLRIKSFTFTVRCGKYGSTSSSAKKAACYFRVVSDFNTSGTDTDTYTALTAQDTLFSGNVSATTYTRTETDYPELLTWMNANINKLLNGYTTNSFGVWLGLKYASVQHANDGSGNLTLNYEYDDTVYYTVSTAVSPTGAGTVSPSTQEVESGATASVTATPATGYRFSHWLLNGSDSGITTPTLSGTITADILCTAVFEKLPPSFSSAQMMYQDKQISNTNKVIAGESFVISVEAT